MRKRAAAPIAVSTRRRPAPAAKPKKGGKWNYDPVKEPKGPQPLENRGPQPLENRGAQPLLPGEKPAPVTEPDEPKERGGDGDNGNGDNGNGNGDDATTETETETETS